MMNRKKENSVTKCWMTALQLTAPIAGQPERIFPAVIDELAVFRGEAPALLSEHESFTYAALARRSNQYARWALAQGIGKDEVVCLLMPNRPEYMAAWLGITKVGGVVALLNTNLRGASLAHSIGLVSPRHIIIAAEFLDASESALPSLASPPTVWVHDRDLSDELRTYSGDPLTPAETRPVTIADRALCIYTSGTTGLPKAANISHGRLMQWTHWFCGLMNAQASDRLYNCLPMYHSAGGLQAPGAILVAGGSVVIRAKFSARQFWKEVAHWDCTAFQYIGELCRYLLHTGPSPHETRHRLRLACGNGLRADVWNDFQDRFRIPRILEFYGATEGSVSLFNVEGEPGAIGRIPSYLAHRFPVPLVKLDIETGQPLRDERGLCLRCAPDEPGEAIGPLRSSNIGSRFEGYTDAAASERKILRHVFEPGDAWYRTGDLMRKDPRGFFYFLDRIGDTFRWKGENVSTCEVSEAICTFPGIREAVVYGVPVPGADGRAGMASISADSDLDLFALRSHLLSRLPAYACPVFFRLRDGIDVTGTFKHRKADLVREGSDPSKTQDPIYFYSTAEGTFLRLDRALYERIQSGDTYPAKLTSASAFSRPAEAARHAF